MTLSRFFPVVLLSLCLVTPTYAQEAADTVAPETATATGAFAGLSEAARAGLAAKQAGMPVSADDWMVVAAHPLAVAAGADVLAQGGTAADAMIRGDDASTEFPSTSHISIVDSYGNALSMTTTIENGFGSRLFVRGFLLNNELTDFSFATHANGYPIANRVEPGKRPRSSMAPTIVTQDGAPVLVIGSPGGSRIIGYVAQAIISHLDWGMDVQQALTGGHLVNRFGTFDIEAGSDRTTLEAPLRALGYDVNLRDLNSGLHAIAIGDTLTGGAKGWRSANSPA